MTCQSTSMSGFVLFQPRSVTGGSWTHHGWLSAAWLFWRFFLRSWACRTSGWLWTWTECWPAWIYPNRSDLWTHETSCKPLAPYVCIRVYLHVFLCIYQCGEFLSCGLDCGIGHQRYTSLHNNLIIISLSSTSTYHRMSVHSAQLLRWLTVSDAAVTNECADGVSGGCNVAIIQHWKILAIKWQHVYMGRH